MTEPVTGMRMIERLVGAQNALRTAADKIEAKELDGAEAVAFLRAMADAFDKGIPAMWPNR